MKNQTETKDEVVSADWACDNFLGGKVIDSFVTHLDKHYTITKNVG